MTQLTTPDQDSTAQETASTPSTTTQETLDLGADFGGDESSSSSTERSTRTETPAFDPATVEDWTRVDPDTVPRQYRPLIQQAKRQQADYTRKTQEVAEQRREVERLQQQYNQLVTQQGQQVNQALEKLTPAQQDLYADLRARLDPEDQGAIDVVQEVFNRASKDTRDQLSTLRQELDTYKQALSLFAQQYQTQQVQQAASQLEEAKSRFGEDRLLQIAPNIRALVQTPNPQTGQRFTVLEAASLLLGETANQAQQQRTTEQQVKRTAQRQAQGTTGLPAENGSGPITDAELFAELQGLGFQ